MGIEEEKKMAAIYACRFVKDGHIVGLGSGSTAAYFVEELGRRIKRENMEILAIPSSYQITQVATKAEIPLTTLREHPQVDIDVDGADEVDPHLNLIKGGRGSLTKEKVIAQVAKKFIVIVDHTKIVSRLGSRFPVPVEVLPDADCVVSRRLKDMGGQPKLRSLEGNGGEVPFITENRNFILDTKFTEIRNPKQLGIEIKSIAGVVEHGIFHGMADLVCVGSRRAVKILRRS
jgi:ribose 5-phosphate isomerase A